MVDCSYRVIWFIDGPPAGGPGPSGAGGLVQATEVDGLGGKVFAALVRKAIHLEAHFRLDDGALEAIQEAVLDGVDLRVVGSQIPGAGAVGIQYRLDDGLQSG